MERERWSGKITRNMTGTGLWEWHLGKGNSFTHQATSTKATGTITKLTARVSTRIARALCTKVNGS